MKPSTVRHLEECMQVADGHKEDLAYNMRMLAERCAPIFYEAAVALRKAGRACPAGDPRHDDLVRAPRQPCKDELRAVGETAARRWRR